MLELPLFSQWTFLLFYLGFYNIYLFLGRGEGREEEGEKHRCEREILTSCFPYVPQPPPDQDQTCNPGKCPDQELNQQPFALWNDARPTEPHCSGHQWVFQQEYLIKIRILLNSSHLIKMRRIFIFLRCGKQICCKCDKLSICLITILETSGRT